LLVPGGRRGGPPCLVLFCAHVSPGQFNGAKEMSPLNPRRQSTFVGSNLKHVDGSGPPPRPPPGSGFTSQSSSASSPCRRWSPVSRSLSVELNVLCVAPVSSRFGAFNFYHRWSGHLNSESDVFLAKNGSPRLCGPCGVSNGTPADGLLLWSTFRWLGHLRSSRLSASPASRLPRRPSLARRRRRPQRHAFRRGPSV
jgi:hypothetical protein